MVNGNAGELTQVVLNLAKNAAEAIGERGGRVRLSTRAEEDRVHVIVEDDGPGIPPETLARLFTPFFTTKEQGTGIGLHISRGIARAHGGELSCVSEVGVGTRFLADLPALAADPSGAESPETTRVARATDL
jgi:two-component system, NtrC family, sensor kinase